MLIPAIFLILACKAYAIPNQAIGVRGQLTCGKDPLKNAQVQVWNKNKNGKEGLLINVTTNATGHFEGVGNDFKIPEIAPQFTIQHTCPRDLRVVDQKVKKICSTKVDLMIQPRYVSHSLIVKEFFDIGRVNMELVFPGEETTCMLKQNS